MAVLNCYKILGKIPVGRAGTCAGTWEPVGVTLGRLGDHRQPCSVALVPHTVCPLYRLKHLVEKRPSKDPENARRQKERDACLTSVRWHVSFTFQLTKDASHKPLACLLRPVWKTDGRWL